MWRWKTLSRTSPMRFTSGPRTVWNTAKRRDIFLMDWSIRLGAGGICNRIYQLFSVVWSEAHTVKFHVIRTGFGDFWRALRRGTIDSIWFDVIIWVDIVFIIKKISEKSRFLPFVSHKSTFNFCTSIWVTLKITR